MKLPKHVQTLLDEVGEVIYDGKLITKDDTVPPTDKKKKGEDD
jgi:hypothetical protein